jgi:hypothetical protein
MHQAVPVPSVITRAQRKINQSSLAAKPLSRDDASVATFIKCEKINFHAKADPAPRIIQPRDPRFNAAIGVYIKPLEKLIYKNLGKLYKYPCVAKGFDV